MNDLVKPITFPVDSQMMRDQDHFLKKILQSREISKSVKYQELLQYLYDCSVQGTPPKEAQIAMDIFKRDLSQNDSGDSAIVRVNVHGLRVKLDNYYLTEGKEDEIVFEIPKGHYEIKFVKRQQSEHNQIQRSYFTYNRQIIFLIVAIAITALFTYFLTVRFVKNEKSKVADSYVWADIMSSNKPVMIVLGDYFFFEEIGKTQNERIIIRNLKINSKKEFGQFLIENPEYKDKYKDLDFSFLGRFAPLCIKELSPLFNVKSKSFEICMMSEFQMHYLQEYNIIFIGLFKTIGLFESFFNCSSFKIIDKNRTIALKNKDGSLNQNFVQEGFAESIHNDYGYISKFPGPNNNIILLISSFHDIGVNECAKKITNYESNESVKEVLKLKYGSVPPYFEMLYKVVGINRTDLNSKVISISRLDPKGDYWNIK